jgi:hypothetical protein
MMRRRRDFRSYSGPSQKLRLACGDLRRRFNPTRRNSMTAAVMLLGPLSVVVGCLYWVMSLGKQQAALNDELWAKHK